MSWLKRGTKNQGRSGLLAWQVQTPVAKLVQPGEVLSTYNAMPAAEEYKERNTRLLGDIRKGLQGQVKKHGQRPDIAEKYQWLISYHNRQATERLRSPEMAIPA